MNKTTFNQSLLSFIAESPDSFHAVQTLSQRLSEAGFEALEETAQWQLQPGGCYFVTRNESALIAFTHAGTDPSRHGVHMAGAHTDSPCLKLKPVPELVRNEYVQLSVEVYGGALYAPWFDRDLSLAGRVDYRNRAGSLASALINLKKPVAIIPSLAIHLDREANQNRSINPQKELLPILMSLAPGEHFSFSEFLLSQLQALPGSADAQQILGHELSFYDTQAPALIGLNEQFIAAARLDNLLSCYVGMEAICQADRGQYNLLVCNDHEEVGSTSSSGAQGPFLKSVLSRIVEQAAMDGDRNRSDEQFERMIRHSRLLSVDNAHGIHPNFADRHDSNHGPLLNRGPVLKINANQRYASNSHSVALFRNLCELENIPVQDFAVRSDMGCGSTIGPITASGLGVETVDVGVPTFAMHSIRELAGADDAFMLFKVMQRYFGARE
ncbi:MAG: M18 family aminopeptidase [Pseudomonadales bacterium]|nr:M18 family aminopeptidase [Pseudomonadales bacterium]